MSKKTDTTAREALRLLGPGIWWLFACTTGAMLIVTLGIFTYDWRLLFWLPVFIALWLGSMVAMGRKLNDVGYYTDEEKAKLDL